MWVTVRIFKNREQAAPPEDQLAQLWERCAGSWWTEFGGALHQSQEDGFEEAPTPGYETWEVAREAVDDEQMVLDELSRIVPSRALVLVKTEEGGRRQYEGFLLHYETVRLHAPREPRPGGYCMELEEAQLRPVDLSGLPTMRQERLGVPGAAVHYLLDLRKAPNFSRTTCKDDATGEAYPYRLARVRVLRRAG